MAHPLLPLNPLGQLCCQKVKMIIMKSMILQNDHHFYCRQRILECPSSKSAIYNVTKYYTLFKLQIPTELVYLCPGFCILVLPSISSTIAIVPAPIVSLCEKK